MSDHDPASPGGEQMAAEVGRMFINAQRAADAIVASAQRTAQSLLDDARRQAEVGTGPVAGDGGDIALAVRSRVETEALIRALDEVEEKLRRSQAQMLDRIATLGEPPAIGTPSPSPTLSLLPPPAKVDEGRPELSVAPVDSGALTAAPTVETSTSDDEELSAREAPRADVAPAGVEAAAGAAVDPAATADTSRPLVEEAFRRPALDLDSPAPAVAGSESPWAWAPPAWPAPGGAPIHDVAPDEPVEVSVNNASTTEPVALPASHNGWAPPTTPEAIRPEGPVSNDVWAPAIEESATSDVSAPVTEEPATGHVAAEPAPASGEQASGWAVPPALAGPVVQAPAIPAPEPQLAAATDATAVAPAPAWDSQALSPWAPPSPDGAQSAWAPPVGAPLAAPAADSPDSEAPAPEAPTLSLVPSIPGSAEAVPAAGPAHAKIKRENPPWLTNVMWAFAVILITAVLLALINLG